MPTQLRFQRRDSLPHVGARDHPLTYEFQDVCLQHYDASVKEVRHLRAASGYDLYDDAMLHSSSIDFLRDRLARFEGLLRWVENQRLAMVALAKMNEGQEGLPQGDHLPRGAPALYAKPGTHLREAGISMPKAPQVTVKNRQRPCTKGLHVTVGVEHTGLPRSSTHRKSRRLYLKALHCQTGSKTSQPLFKTRCGRVFKPPSRFVPR